MTVAQLQGILFRYPERATVIIRHTEGKPVAYSFTTNGKSYVVVYIPDEFPLDLPLQEVTHYTRELC